MRQLRVFATSLAGAERRLYGGVLVFFCAVFAAMLWPIYPIFSAARPLVFGLPLSLFYLAVLAHEYGIDLGEALAQNIAKLRARHPDGWSPGYHHQHGE